MANACRPIRDLRFGIVGARTKTGDPLTTATASSKIKNKTPAIAGDILVDPLNDEIHMTSGMACMECDGELAARFGSLPSNVSCIVSAGKNTVHWVAFDDGTSTAYVMDSTVLDAADVY